MVIFIVCVSLAFLWLMIETKWLTIRLEQYYREEVEVAIQELIEIIPIVVATAVLVAVLKKLGTIKPPRTKTKSHNILTNLLNKLNEIKVKVWGSPLP